MSARGKSHIKATPRFLAQQKDQAAIQQAGNTWVEGVLGGRSGFQFGCAIRRLSDTGVKTPGSVTTDPLLQITDVRVTFKATNLLQSSSKIKGWAFHY